MWPQPADDHLANFYNSDYRYSEHAIELGDSQLDMPVQFPSSVLSFQRFKTFFDCIEKNITAENELRPTANDSFIDYGGYQGLFLYAVNQTYGSDCVVYDHSDSGIEFAKKAFGFQDSVVSQDITSDTFERKFSFVTMLQVLEHLKEPEKVLKHIRQNVIEEDGYLFVEVPNLYGFPLSDPVHVYAYQEKSLQCMLERCGFVVLDIYYDGYPDSGDLFDNEERKVVCLARAGESKSSFPNESPETIIAEMRNRYRRHSYAAIRTLIKDLFKKAYQTSYYLIHVFVLERLFPYNLYNLKKRIKSAFK